jgi:hypothetical protein
MCGLERVLTMFGVTKKSSSWYFRIPLIRILPFESRFGIDMGRQNRFKVVAIS